MKLGIMQPYFFPYLGYFQLINAVDQWVVFDIPQYIRHGWINRNRILHPQAGPKYVIVPLEKHQKDARINELKLHPELEWKPKILSQIKEYYGREAPFADEVIGLAERSLDPSQTMLVSVLMRTLSDTCNLLGISFNPILASEIDLNEDNVQGPGDWALEICRALGFDQYVNPVGGKDIFDPEVYVHHGVELCFLRSLPSQYRQFDRRFVADLSILDVLVWNGTDEREGLLENCEIVLV